jgi:hypothetical protein
LKGETINLSEVGKICERQIDTWTVVVSTQEFDLSDENGSSAICTIRFCSGRGDFCLLLWFLLVYERNRTCGDIKKIVRWPPKQVCKKMNWSQSNLSWTTTGTNNSE